MSEYPTPYRASADGDGPAEAPHAAEDGSLAVDAVKELEDACCRMALIVSVADAQRLVAEFDRMDTWMPILDPTGYRAIMNTAPGHKRVAEAFLAFRQALEEEISDARPPTL